MLKSATATVARLSRNECALLAVLPLKPTHQPHDGVAPPVARPQGALLCLVEIRHSRRQAGSITPARMHGVDVHVLV